MSDGLGGGFIGRAEAVPWLGGTVLLVLNIGLFALAWRMFARGYKLKT